MFAMFLFYKNITFCDETKSTFLNFQSIKSFNFVNILMK